MLLGAIIALTLAYVYILVLLNQWNNAFYTALQDYETDKIFSELFHFSWLAVIYIIVAVYSFYLQQILALNWWRWLTNAYLDEWSTIRPIIGCKCSVLLQITLTSVSVKT